MQMACFTERHFQHRVIPAKPDRSVAAFYAASFPSANFLDPLQQGPSGCGAQCNNFLGSTSAAARPRTICRLRSITSSTTNSKLFVEYLLNPSWYTNYRLPWSGPTAQTSGIAGAQPYRTMNQIFTIGHTQTFGGSSLINEARASFSRQNQRATPNPDSLVNNKGVEAEGQGLEFYLGSQSFSRCPSIGIGSGYPGFGPQQWQNAIQGEDAFTVLDNVTKIVGAHTLKAGMMWRRDRNWNLAGWGYNLGFGGGSTNDPVTGLGGNGLAQFLLGAVDPGQRHGHLPRPLSKQ